MNILFLGTAFDNSYLYGLKKATKGMHNVTVRLDKIETLYEVTAICKRIGAGAVICSKLDILKKLITDDTPDKQITLSNFAGNLLVDSATGIQYLIVNPLKQTRTVRYGQFMLDRYVSKLIKPDNWLEAPDFDWEVFTPGSAEEIYRKLKGSFLIAVDIETTKLLEISCIGFCGVWKSPETGKLKAFSTVIPMNSEFNLAWARKICTLPISKITQNGKYDNNYMLRYNIVMAHWLWDTANLMHSWYSELPKDLGFLASFCIRNARYWKSDVHSMSDSDLYLYNAKDVYNTALITLALVYEMPAWAMENYKTEFPMNYPCLVSELTGMKASEEKLQEILADTRTKEEQATDKLRLYLSSPHFNPGSSQQVKRLFTVLGCGDIKSSDEANLNVVGFRHPLNQLLVDLILEIRGLRKLISTYLVPEKLFCGRVLYALNPHGTDTGRLASKAHHFWCGLQIQNIPRSGRVKDFMVADEGFLIGEADYAQAESRGTAYITGDEALLAAVNSSRDFHAVNASAFFGVPYEEIVHTDKHGVHKTLNKPLRNLAKRVNHGANYNMGDAVLVSTMGLKAIYEAKDLLGLVGVLSPKMIAGKLLGTFATTYKKVKFDLPVWIKRSVVTTHKLRGATGWTRYCFGSPDTNKPDLNAYIAHVPQSLNAQILNRGYKAVYEKVWKPYHENFKLNAQIHDSTLYQYRIGHDFLNALVVDCMTMDIEVTDIAGITRTMRVPVDVDCGGTSWKDSKDS